MAGENRCVCCGAVIPEGRQCCPVCANKFMEEGRKVLYNGVAKCQNGKTIAKKGGTLEEMTRWADDVLFSGDIIEISIREAKRGKKNG